MSNEVRQRSWLEKRMSEGSTRVGVVALICAVGTIFGIGFEKDAVSGAIMALETEHYTAFASALAGIVAMILRDRQHADEPDEAHE